MSISEYLTPVNSGLLAAQQNASRSLLGNVFRIHSEKDGFPSLENIDMVILGVEEDRRAVSNEGCGMAPDAIRKKLYALYEGNNAVRLADLGNIKRGFSVEDSYFALTTVLTELIRNNIVPVILGGGQDLTYANYLAYQQLQQTINIVAVDSSFDMGDADSELNSKTYLGKIILQQPNFLFNYSNLGYQSYFVSQDSIHLMSKLYFDTYRLGQIRSDMADAEPILRNADMISFDISSVRQSDAPGNMNASPNGFFGDEACRLARYAGMSEKLSSIGFYEINPVSDKAEQTTSLVAQMVWYFMDGFYNRKNDYPIDDKSSFLKYLVSLNDNKHEIVFYKSNKSDRWWMSVPYPPEESLKYERHHLVPCSYKDYQTACNNEMPDRWHQTFQKLS